MARDLARRIYSASRMHPFCDDWELRNQIRRAIGSVMHNIAEGFDSGSDNEFCRFLAYAQRSCTEIKSELYLALDQAYLTEPEFNELYTSAQAISDKIGGLIKYLKNKNCA